MGRNCEGDIEIGKGNEEGRVLLAVSWCADEEALGDTAFDCRLLHHERRRNLSPKTDTPPFLPTISRF